MTKIKAVNTLHIKKGKADEVLELFAKPKSVHTIDGFILMEVLKTENTEEYDVLQICTTWEDASYFEIWREGRAARKAHAAKEEGEQTKKDSPILDTELSIYEVC